LQQGILNTPIDVTACKRLRSKDAANTCRPLLVTVKDSVQVWSVLKTARKLGESADYKSVFVKKDSTPLERAVFARSGRRESGGKARKIRSITSKLSRQHRLLTDSQKRYRQVISRNDVRRSRPVNNVGSNRIHQSESAQKVLKCFRKNSGSVLNEKVNC
jgi:hypothetical protein